ncbi:DUF3780 domain-containing protein [uncultured Lamprocystis sp.]|jgi:hypothetical protein|uniref:DUF3780 domain-containing protein n=1 Tax=uncultured Lamprocystis sp. TaxID=543132 RepID=UPI0025FC9A29|nr:DUF3780 domain-containing protein [uncultured Lamprocystis sp.]
MAIAKKPVCLGFGFCPEESAHHFLVTIPAGNREDVLISEHFTWDADGTASRPTFALGEAEGKLRVMLPRAKWDAIADEVRVEINKRLKQDGIKSGSWKTGANPVSRLLGKELVLLAWAIEEADPALIPAAIRNWLGLVPEERWWLYTMTSAATGHAIQGRGKGWRKAVRYALTENPVSGLSHEPLPVFELQRHQASPALPVPTPAPAERKAVRAPRRAKTKEAQPER